MKKTRKQVNNVILKGKNNDIITSIKTAKGLEGDPCRIANCLNDYFRSVAKKKVSYIILDNFYTSP